MDAKMESRMYGELWKIVLRMICWLNFLFGDCCCGCAFGFGRRE